MIELLFLPRCGFHEDGAMNVLAIAPEAQSLLAPRFTVGSGFREFAKKSRSGARIFLSQ